MRRGIGVMAVGVLVAGCAGAPATVDSNEAFLAAAGFRVLAGDTSGYAAAARQLPPHKFVHRTEQGILTYYYFDPTVCGCLYYGSAQNWAAYRQEVADKWHIEAEQMIDESTTPTSNPGGI
jgi:hypothetical protein